MAFPLHRPGRKARAGVAQQDGHIWNQDRLDTQRAKISLALSAALSRASAGVWSPYIALPSSVLSSVSTSPYLAFGAPLGIPQFFISFAKPVRTGLALYSSGSESWSLSVGSSVPLATPSTPGTPL